MYEHNTSATGVRTYQWKLWVMNTLFHSVGTQQLSPLCVFVLSIIEVILCLSALV